MEKVSCKCHSFVSRQHTAWQLTDTCTKAFYPVGQKASYKRPQVHKHRHKPTMARISCKCIHNLVPLYTHTHSSTIRRSNWDDTWLSSSSNTLLQVFSLGDLCHGCADLCHGRSHYMMNMDGRKETMNVGQSETFPADMWQSVTTPEKQSPQKHDLSCFCARITSHMTHTLTIGCNQAFHILGLNGNGYFIEDVSKPRKQSIQTVWVPVTARKTSMKQQ